MSYTIRTTSQFATPTPCTALPIKGEMPEGQRGSNTPHGSPHKGGDARRAERVLQHSTQPAPRTDSPT